MSSRTDLLVRISELYYQQNLSQQDISKITGISRPTISRLLDEAKETGVVEIIVHMPGRRWTAKTLPPSACPVHRTITDISLSPRRR